MEIINIEDLLIEAEKGNAEAMFNLGVCYYDGIGVEQDYAEAIEWWGSAAEWGVAKAQFNLASCYANGIGVEQDIREAVRLFRKAARLDMMEAQYYLGLIYANGLGVTKNETEARKWLTMAAEQGYEDAIQLLDSLGPEKKEYGQGGFGSSSRAAKRRLERQKRAQLVGDVVYRFWLENKSAKRIAEEINLSVTETEKILIGQLSVNNSLLQSKVFVPIKSFFEDNPQASVSDAQQYFEDEYCFFELKLAKALYDKDCKIKKYNEKCLKNTGNPVVAVPDIVPDSVVEASSLFSTLTEEDKRQFANQVSDRVIEEFCTVNGREDLDNIEDADLLDRLRDKYGMTEKELVAEFANILDVINQLYYMNEDYEDDYDY